MSKILEIKNLFKNFGGVKALDGASLNIEKGKIVAIIGPNGSGKSTLFNAISNLIRADRGEIFLDRINLGGKEDYEISKTGIARTFQDVRLFRNLTIRDHLEIALSKDDEKLFRNIFFKEENRLARIKEILALVGLDKPLGTLATDLSYGQRKLLDLAVAVAKPHELLMLDEPVAGVNPHLRKEIKKILRKLNGEGETIIIIEHDMNFVMDMADNIYVLEQGKVIAEGSPKEIQNNKHVLEAYLGE
jgi:branched-chain amino acid transport system ATP-binding protein